MTGTGPFTYLWQFGDGVTSTTDMPTHTYMQTGTYNTTLQVWNCGPGGHDTLTQPVVVSCGYTIYIPLVLKGYSVR